MSVSSNGLEIARQNTETRSIQYSSCYRSPSTGRNSEPVLGSNATYSGSSKKDIWKHFEPVNENEAMAGSLGLRQPVGRGGSGTYTDRATPECEARHDAKRAARNLHYESETSHIHQPSCSEMISGDREEDSELWSLALVAKRLREAPDIDTTNKDIVGFLGGTGVGKTTTIDFCCYAKMVEVRSDDQYDDTVRIDVCQSEREKFLRIGHGKSMTKTIDLLVSPAKQKRKKSEILFCGMSSIPLAFAYNINPFLFFDFLLLFVQICRDQVMTTLWTKS
jgi:hypothetical protein